MKYTWDGDRDPEYSLTRVFDLFGFDHLDVEELLQPLVREVDTELKQTKGV